jgi:membrane protease YdiL (CAAX protease family)
MSDSEANLVRINWEWKLSFEVASYTLLLDLALSISLNLILISISDQMGFQILGSPYGTAIFGASETLLLLPLLIYTRKFGISRHQLGIHIGNRSQLVTDIVFGVIIGVSMIPISMIAIALNEVILGPQPEADYVKGSLTATSLLQLLLLLFSIIIIVAPVEEIITRGFVQQGFERSFGDAKGLVFSSLVFALIHLNVWSIFPLTVLGMMLGLCFRLRHNRLLAPVISHALYMVYLVVSVSY